MKNTNRIRRAGRILIAAGLLWAVAIVIEYRFGLKPPGHSTLYYINQSMFFVAQAGYVTGIIGVIWARAAGDGWFGKLALSLFVFGWVVLLVAQPLAWITGNNNLLLFPVGGLAALVGGLLAGVAVVVARRWSGWQRFSVLLYALYYFLVMMLPLIIMKQGPTLVTESFWGLAWLPMGIALVNSAGVARTHVQVGPMWKTTEMLD